MSEADEFETVERPTQTKKKRAFTPAITQVQYGPEGPMLVVMEAESKNCLVVNIEDEDVDRLTDIFGQRIVEGDNA